MSKNLTLVKNQVEKIAVQKNRVLKKQVQKENQVQNKRSAKKKIAASRRKNAVQITCCTV